ncbi:phage/plasmid replication protein, II/X family [Acinetobacter sp. ULE_I057]|uniref:phage/plasmid replication protein, II/X family n=1 Tax=Acinetobacter sp. ULE_I057 TaxID=3373070 RepID=UPI003AF47D43
MLRSKKGSPLKLLQGHNVYGFESLELGTYHMIGMLLAAFPKLGPILDVPNTELSCLDTTQLIRLPHQNMVQPVLDYMANLSSGHRKAREIKYNNYISWGNDGASVRPKAYGKFEEVKSQLHKIQKLADKGCSRSKALVCAMHDALPFANAIVRLEGRISKTYLSKNGYPTNIWELIEFQKQQPDLLLRLWHVAFDPILKTMEGEYMNFATDAQLEDLLKSKLVTYTKKGNPSYVRAYNALEFYNSLRLYGWKVVLARHTKSRFSKRKNDLIECGISLSHLQNLHKNPNGKVIPFVRLLELKMCDQLPPDYQIPVSPYTPNERLHLVA